MKRRTHKKSNNNNTNGIDFHRNCHLAYVPQMISKNQAPRKKPPQNIKYEQYIKINEDGGQESSDMKKCYIQEIYPVILAASKDNHDQEIKRVNVICVPTEKNVPKHMAESDIDESYYNHPAIVDTGPTKSVCPIKKISFETPSGKLFKDDEKLESDLEPMDWNDYHQLGVIHKFLDDLELDFPSLCTTGIVGTSLEGRSLKILKISNSNASNASVWVDAGIHGREWIAPAVNTYLADYITRNFEQLPESIKNKDWYFHPVVNPDGYEYSHTHYRMWRKNRAKHGREYVGVDLNRNFSVGWGGKGSSDIPTSAFYRGPHPFSEPESLAIRDVFLSSGIKFKVYITLHSYGQIIIFPYACSSDLAPDYVRLLEGATAMSKAIYDTNGNTYKVGISRDVMYGAAGTSNDFAYGAAGIPYCYLIELRSKQHKFTLPKEEIEVTCNEILNCVIALMEFVDTYTYNKRTDDSGQVTESRVSTTDSLANRSNSHVQRSGSVVNPVNSVKKRDSYNKGIYSHVKTSDTSITNTSSYVRWIDTLKRDTFERTGDSCTKINDSTFDKASDFAIETDFYEGGSDFNVKSFSENTSDSFLHTNESFMYRTECYKDASDSFLKRIVSSIKKDGFCFKKNCDFKEKRNSYVNTDFNQR